MLLELIRLKMEGLVVATNATLRVCTRSWAPEDLEQIILVYFSECASATGWKLDDKILCVK